MVTRSLSRRLERLEQRVMPATVRRVWRIVIIHPDGRREHGEKLEWLAPARRDVPASGNRYRYCETSGGCFARVNFLPPDTQFVAPKSRALSEWRVNHPELACPSGRAGHR